MIFMLQLHDRRGENIMQDVLNVLFDVVIDMLKLIPFLFITYLVMEFIEHKVSDKSKKAIEKSGRFGPIIGGLLGIVPQCGFSVSATNFYAGRVIGVRNINCSIFIYI